MWSTFSGTNRLWLLLSRIEYQLPLVSSSSTLSLLACVIRHNELYSNDHTQQLLVLQRRCLDYSTRPSHPPPLSLPSPLPDILLSMGRGHQLKPLLEDFEMVCYTALMYNQSRMEGAGARDNDVGAQNVATRFHQLKEKYQAKTSTKGEGDGTTTTALPLSTSTSMMDRKTKVGEEEEPIPSLNIDGLSRDQLIALVRANQCRHINVATFHQ
jgi:hypothetical protein